MIEMPTLYTYFNRTLCLVSLNYAGKVDKCCDLLDQYNFFFPKKMKCVMKDAIVRTGSATNEDETDIDDISDWPKVIQNITSYLKLYFVV